MIYFHEDQRYELYDLSNDIGEQNNLASKEASKLSELIVLLSEYLISVEAQMPRDKETQIQIPYPTTKELF